MLFNGMKDRYVTITGNMIPDGVGGYIPGEIIEGVEFEAAISTDLSTEAMIGGAIVARQNYTFAIPLEVPLLLKRIFKRRSDGQFFRVTSTPDDMRPPEYSAYKYYQISAEAVDGP